MKLIPIFEMQMHYTWIDYVDYGAGGQYVGTLEGTVTGDRLRGMLKSVNVPAKRPDNVNCPAFRGIIVTDDEATTTDQALVRAFACENELATAAV